MSSKLLRQIARSVNFAPEFTQALDYAATNAPGALLAVGWGQFFFGGADLLEHPELDLRVHFARVSPILSRVDRWWPDSNQGGAP